MNRAPDDRHAAVREALEKARSSGEDETVVFHLRAAGADASAAPGAAETEEMARRVVKNAAASCKHKPEQMTVFQNLGSMVVKGNAELLLKILDQPEIQAATTNRPQGGPVEPIRPVRKGPASKSGWVDVPD